MIRKTHAQRNKPKHFKPKHSHQQTYGETAHSLSRVNQSAPSPIRAQEPAVKSSGTINNRASPSGVRSNVVVVQTSETVAIMLLPEQPTGVRKYNL